MEKIYSSVSANLIEFNQSKAKILAEIIRNIELPEEQEAIDHSFDLKLTNDQLANCYFAIVAICHQTSPLGERPFEGYIGKEYKKGWNYLKEKFLLAANADNRLALPEFWESMTPTDLSELYYDYKYGLTLNRITERSYLLNDIGKKLTLPNYTYIKQAFETCESMISGKNGFLNHLQEYIPYTDPLNKKAFFFLSLAKNECSWKIKDEKFMLSPIDYHEIRGHLRIGTILICDKGLLNKVVKNLPITDDEDIAIRSAAQQANDWIAKQLNITNSVLHYFFWNTFRSCCLRQNPHCSNCAENCSLPIQYKNLRIYSKKCIFESVCSSREAEIKVIDPPYLGHYY